MIEKLKETAISILPIAAIVVLLDLTIAPLPKGMTGQFLFGVFLSIAGLSLFLLGADIGIIPFGEKAGAALTSRRNLALLLGAAFVIGFFITIAEPDVQVLITQIQAVDPDLPGTALLLMIACGIGLFIVVGLIRTVFHIPMKWILTGCYGLVLLLCLIAPSHYIPIAFDASGATTGPMTVPFILALGVGVAAVQSHSKNSGSAGENSFGMTGMASVGPIVAVLVMGIIMGGKATGGSDTEMLSDAAVQSTSTLDSTLQYGLYQFHLLMGETFLDVVKALAPLVAMFVVFQILLLHMPPRQLIRMTAGIVYAFIGLVLFLLGVNGGFMVAGRTIGVTIGSASYRNVLIVLGAVLGAIVVCAEPAVWVLTRQVEDVSNGAIKKRTLLIALASGVAIAIALAVWRVLAGFSLTYILLPGYIIAIALTFFCPPLFTAIAFDSGGVSSGPMTTTFILSFCLGASSAVGGNPLTDAFGVIALVALAPLIAIQLLGLIFGRKMRMRQTASGAAVNTKEGTA